MNDLRQACAMGETAKFIKLLVWSEAELESIRCIVNGVVAGKWGRSKRNAATAAWEIAAATPLALHAKGHVKIARALIEAGCDIATPGQLQ